jgi:hypothetical protein
MVAETEASRAAREAAEELGPVAGSSYTTFEGRPFLWAFDVQREPHGLVVAGGEETPGRVLLWVAEEHVFSVMLYGKALVGSSADPLEPHLVTLIEEIPPQASWYCDSFYLTRRRITGMRDGDLLAVALHAGEAGMSPDAAESAVAARSPDLVSSPDPNAGHPGFRRWFKLVRSLRRLARLRELAAPEVIIENEIRIARRLWEEPDVRDLAEWPADLVAVAGELGLGRPAR